MSAGKGDKPRPVDRKKFENNFDLIFRKSQHIGDGFIESSIKEYGCYDTPQKETEKWRWKMDYLYKRKMHPTDYWDVAENAWREHHHNEKT